MPCPATTTGLFVVGRATSPAGLTSLPASALTSVLLPVPVPPSTPTTSTRASSCRSEAMRGSISAQSAAMFRAGGQGEHRRVQRPIDSTRSSIASRWSVGSVSSVMVTASGRVRVGMEGRRTGDGSRPSRS